MKKNKKSFKPCYKWIIFNIYDYKVYEYRSCIVLNLVING